MADPAEDEREEELSSLTAIYPELAIDSDDPFSAALDIPVAPTNPLLVRFVPDTPSHKALSSQSPADGRGLSYATATATSNAHIEHDIHLSHLPPLRLHLTLPTAYPAQAPLKVRLSTDHTWLPEEKLEELRQEAEKLWEDYGRGQTAFVYIDHLQQAAENGFSLEQCSHGLLVLSASKEKALIDFDAQTKLAKFREGTYDCGICLEPKKGTMCYQMEKCGHVFCLACLHGYYENAIKEGDVTNVSCLDPTCGKDPKRKAKKKRSIHPRELLNMGISEDTVRRFVEMKRKKKIESDKNTVYCPRSWCQGPARSTKYPPVPKDLVQYVADEGSSEDEDVAATSPVSVKSPPTGPADPTERLCICEKCSYAFCRVCFSGWHGPYQRCYPRDPNELSAEEKASYEFILQNTTPCPTCGSPVEKSHGCNHMTCFQCRHHFCYLCSSWLEPGNPYKHFNTPGKECFQRLFELDQGDDGQGPADGRGFGGDRMYEQMAIEAAREAEEAEERERLEAEVAAGVAERARVNTEMDQLENDIGREDQVVAAVLQADLLARADAPLLQPPVPVGAGADGLAVRLNGLHVVDPAPPAPPHPVIPRGQQNHPGANPPLPRVQPDRRGLGGRRPFNPHLPAPGRADAVRQHERNVGRGAPRQRPALQQDDEIQRFLQLAARDEEDGWDSDELGDDEGFVIR